MTLASLDTVTPLTDGSEWCTVSLHTGRRVERHFLALTAARSPRVIAAYINALECLVEPGQSHSIYLTLPSKAHTTKSFAQTRAPQMKILHLTLKKKWFDMVASGEKPEEYREMKPYWVTRLADKHVGAVGGDFMDKHHPVAYSFKDFDVVRFKNGYASTAPTMDVEFKGIRIGGGRDEWGAPGGDYFNISLGEILTKSFQEEEVGLDPERPT